MYGNDVKARWRDELWRTAARYASKDGWVMALAGARFLDRKAAKRCGFSGERIVGVDTDPEVEAHNTRFGRTVIGMPLAEAVAAWSPARPVSVLNADYCSNCTASDIQLMVKAWLGNSAFSDSILCVTVSVGRERGPLAQQLRLMSDECGVRMAGWNRAAYVLLDTVADSLWRAAELVVQHDQGDAVIGADPQGWALDAAVKWFKSGRVWERSYKAHTMRMDSCMVLHPDRCRGMRCASDEFHKRVGDPAARRTIAAKLAWQTMRGQAH